MSLDGQALLRINRVLERFEDGWQCGRPGPIEDLLRGEPDRGVRGELLYYALAVELEHRGRLGESPAASEYERRFPDHVEVVRVAFTEVRTATMPQPSPRSRRPYPRSWR